MNKEDVLKKLDVDANGKVNLDDLLALANGNIRNAMLIGMGIGFVIGFIVKAII